jgi:hypothetical protein
MTKARFEKTIISREECWLAKSQQKCDDLAVFQTFLPDVKAYLASTNSQASDEPSLDFRGVLIQHNHTG